MQQALMIGNSDGIGQAATKRLLSNKWKIVGISRSEWPIRNPLYHHHIADVGDIEYTKLLDELLLEYSFDLCIYFAGIGELLDLQNMRDEPRIIDVNLTGMVRTAAAIIPKMVEAGKGHFIGISSLADDLFSNLYKEKTYLLYRPAYRYSFDKISQVNDVLERLWP